MAKKILFIPLGIMLGAAVIGLSFPFLTGGIPGADQNIIPRFANQWHVGKGAEEKPILQYLVKYKDMEFLAQLEFLDQTENDQKINLIIDDRKTGQHLEQKLSIGKAYVFLGVTENVKPYVNVLDKTVFSVRDTIVESKYLVVGAEWGVTYVGKLTPKLKLTEYGDTQFDFGTLKTFLVSYEINKVKNKLWIVENIPLPVKAEYYNLDGTPDYSYDLVKLEST